MSFRNRTALESLLSLLLGLGALGKHGHRTNVVDFRAKHLGSIILSVVRDLQAIISWPPQLQFTIFRALI